MKETQFIKQNKEKWKSFEQILRQENASPEELKDIYIQVTDDLSYARTFYPNRSVRVYLNSISKNVYNKINAYKKTKKDKIISFWTDDLPKLVYESRTAFNLSFFVFILAILIGAFSSAMDPEFVRTILGDSYVEMTLQNIEEGDPMRVYKNSKELGMTAGITFNNLFVAFLTFLMGVLYMVGSIGILISNGVMVGSFQYFFYEHGFLLESFLTIWMHGALEISAIIIAGAAGITMGQGLAFPGTYSRSKAFQISAKRGMKIMVGITPIFIVAGFIEGFVTRHTELPNVFRALFILSCFGFVIWYFFIFPRIKNKEGFKEDEDFHKLQADNLHQFEYLKIKSSGQLFNETFLYYARSFGIVALFLVVISLLFTLTNTIILKINLVEIFSFSSDPFSKLSEIPQLFYNVNESYLFPLNVVLIAAILIFTCFIFEKKVHSSGEVSLMEEKLLQRIFKYVGVLFISAVIVGVLRVSSMVAIIAIPFALPFLLLWTYATFKGPYNFFIAFGETWKMYFSNFSKIIGLSFSFWLLGAFFYSFVQWSLFWFLMQMVSWNLDLAQADLNNLVYAGLLFFSYFNFLLIFVLNLFGFAFAYYALREESEGLSLLKEIENISFDSKIRGIVKES